MPRLLGLLFLFAAASSLGACGSSGSADGSTPDGGALDSGPTWQLVHEELPGGLLRVWGTSSRDVYAVGADGDGNGSLVLHFDGDRWTRLDTGTTGDLWWVHGVGPDDVRMVGEAGLVLRYRPSTGAFERITGPDTEVVLFGVWGRAPDDVWYVGGVPAGLRGAVWRDDGAAVLDVTPSLGTTMSTVFKVHGFSDGSLWVVGQDGLTSAWDGTAFTAHASGTTEPLFTVHGQARSRVIAVGGAVDGVILAWDGAAWSNETPPGAPMLSAAWIAGPDLAYAAGFNGRIYRRAGDTWTEVQDVPTFEDLHSIWVDELGGVWAAGGRLASDPPRGGVLVHLGHTIATGLP